MAGILGEGKVGSSCNADDRIGDDGDGLRLLP